jgi:hypothetical protein
MMDDRRVIGVIEAEGSRDPVDAALVHLLEHDHVGAAKAVTLEHRDGPIDLLRLLDVEGDHPKRAAGRRTRRRVLAQERGLVRAQQVGRGRATGRQAGAGHEGGIQDRDSMAHDRR